MDSENEDSDATVAPDADEPVSDEENNVEADGDKSPSLLNTQVEAFDGCCGGRSEDLSQPISPEFPLASNAEGTIPRAPESSMPVECQSVVASSGSSSQRQVVDNSEPETSASVELDEVVRQQTALLSYLQQIQSEGGSNSHELKKLREKANELETSLKEIGIANQTERKKLATAHSSLSQNSQSQASAKEVSGSLRQQLLSLANRQKTLLQCFKTQKEVMEKLDKLLVQVKDSHNGAPLHEAESESKKEAKKASTSHSAAIPNLLQHLKPQIQTQFQRSNSDSQHPHLEQQHLSSTFTTVTAQAQPPSMTTTFTQQYPPPSTTACGSVNTPQNPAVQPLLAATQRPTATQQQQVQSQVLSEPVPLKTLIQHKFLQPGEDCISCVLMGCEFTCSLLEDGSLCSSTGSHYKTPNQWVQYCWSQLGQHKHHINTKFAFKHVMNRGIPLMSICEQFNRKQVCTYHQLNVQKTGIMEASMAQLRQMNVVKSCVPGKLVAMSAPPKVSWNVNDLLMAGQVFLVNDSSHAHSLQLPLEFWRGTDNLSLTPHLMQQFEKDLKW